MKIRKSRPDELELLVKMYENARLFMAGQGNPSQWGQSYPKKTLIETDIKSGCSMSVKNTDDHCHILL